MAPTKAASRKNLKEDLVSFLLWVFPEVSFVAVAKLEDDTTSQAKTPERGSMTRHILPVQYPSNKILATLDVSLDLLVKVSVPRRHWNALLSVL